MKKKLLWNINNTLAKTMAAVMVCSAVTVGGSGFVFAEDDVTVAESVEDNSESADVPSDSTENTNDEGNSQSDSEENRGGYII